jgi:signal transduction histidine kinase
MDTLSQEITIIAVGCLFLLVVAIGIIIIVLVYQKRQLHHILEKKQLQSQYAQELLKARLEAHEETLTQLSKELHDNLGQLLNSSKLLVSVAKQKYTDEAIDMAHETLTVALQELRGLTKALDSEWLERFDFVQNLRAEAQRINTSKNLVMTLEHPDQLTMPKDRQLVLFRMVQEVFQNALKHAHASHIRVSARQNDHDIEVEVIDDGQGFPATAVPAGGLGIQNIKHRTSLMGGVVEWLSGPTGTRVRIQLPLSS